MQHLTKLWANNFGGGIHMLKTSDVEFGWLIVLTIRLSLSPLLACILSFFFCVLTAHGTVCICHAGIKGYLLTYLLTYIAKSGMDRRGSHSVHPSVTQVDQSKRLKLELCNFHRTVARFRLSSFCRISFIKKFWRIPPERKRQTRVDDENKSHFLALWVNISKTVEDTSKVTIND